jgi:Flp pilus assembly protein TadB
VTALAGLAGGLAFSGLALLVLEFTRSAPASGTPRGILLGPRAVISRKARHRMLIALAAGVITVAITRWPVAMIAAVLAVLYVPRVTSSRAAQRHVAVLEGLEQWTRRLSDMLTASRGIEDALEASVRYAPAAVAPAVGGLGRRLAARSDTEKALRAFAADVADPAGDRIAAALIIATGRRGGAVHDVLIALARMLARDVATRREIEADRAQHRTTVKWLTLFALGFAVFALVNKTYSAPFGTLPGQVVMAVVLTLYACGFGWLHHLGAVPAPGRFLAPAPTGPTIARSATRGTSGTSRSRSGTRRGTCARGTRGATGRMRRRQ